MNAQRIANQHHATWDKFKRVIEKAIEACGQSGNEPDDHFSQTGKMVDIGSAAKREIEDYRLSRYACYLIVQNGEIRNLFNGFQRYLYQDAPAAN